MWFLALRDLQHRKVRTVATILLIGLVMTLLFLMTGLVGQFQAEPRLATDRSGGDLDWIVPVGDRGPFTNGQVVDDSLISDLIAEGASSPVLVGRSVVGDDSVVVVGREFPLGELPLTEGSVPGAPDEVVVNDALDLSAGDRILLGEVPATVSGVTTDATLFAGLSMVFANVPLVQEAVASGAPIVSGVLVDPGVDMSLGNLWQRQTAGDVAADAALPLEDAIGSIDLVRALLWLITIIVVAATTYIAALERTKDVAVMKAVGGRAAQVVGGLVVQAVIVAVGAVLVAMVLQRFAQPLFPMTVRIPSRAWWQVPVAAVIVAAVASYLSARRIGSTPPQEAFS